MNYIVEKDFVVDGFRCVIIGTRNGHRCGYVEIQSGHPYYGLGYNAINEDDIEIHGRWTYSEYTKNKYPIETSRKSWWIGFDCGHSYDGKDLDLLKVFGYDEYIKHIIELENKYGKHGEVRSVKYVENELIRAVSQLSKY